jgi:hypothetical protein
LNAIAELTDLVRRRSQRWTAPETFLEGEGRK